MSERTLEIFDLNKYNHSLFKHMFPLSPHSIGAIHVSKQFCGYFPSACGNYVVIEEALREKNTSARIQFHYLRIEEQKITKGPISMDQFPRSTVTPDGYHLLMVLDSQRGVYVIEVFNIHSGKQVQRWVLPSKCFSLASSEEVDAIQVIPQRCCLLIRIRRTDHMYEDVRYYVCKPSLDMTASVLTDLCITIASESHGKENACMVS